MSTKNFIDDSSKKLRISILISICVHAVLVWFLLVSGPKLGWLTKRADLYKKPAIVRIVELPPGYKPPKTTKKPPKHPTRYADRTSIVDKENIPEAGKVTVRRRIKIVQPGGRKPSAGKKSVKKSVKKADKKTGGGTPENGVKGSILKKSSGMKGGENAAGKKTFGAAAASKTKEAPVKKSDAGKTGEKLPEPAGGAKVLIAKKPGGQTGTVKSSKGAGEKAATGRGGGGAAQNNPGAQGASGGPNLLLSEGQVAELERAYRSAPHKGEKNRTLLLNTSELKYQKYFINLKHKIELYWEYPAVAVRNGWQGKLEINFAINKDGTLKFVRTKTSSRYPILDDAAETAIKLAAPFPPFPKNFNVSEIKINGQFVYNIVNIPARHR